MAYKFNADAIAKDREKREGGSYLQLKEGDTDLYLCPPCREDDELPYLDLLIHWNVGQGPLMCLDAKRNTIMTNPKFIKAAKSAKRAIETKKGCPVCNEITSKSLWDTDRDRAAKIYARSAFPWNTIPIRHRTKASEPWTNLQPALKPWTMPKTLWEAITDLIMERPDMIDPDAAVFIRVNRKGTGTKTQYNVSFDSESLAKPVKLSKPYRALIRKSQEVGGEGDLYLKSSEMLAGYDELEAAISGIELEEEKGGDGDDERKPCFGIDWEDDEDCRACEDFDSCKKATDKAAKAAKADDEPEPDDDPGEAAEDDAGDTDGDDAGDDTDDTAGDDGAPPDDDDGGDDDGGDDAGDGGGDDDPEAELAELDKLRAKLKAKMNKGKKKA